MYTWEEYDQMEAAGYVDSALKSFFSYLHPVTFYWNIAHNQKST